VAVSPSPACKPGEVNQQCESRAYRHMTPASCSGGCSSEISSSDTIPSITCPIFRHRHLVTKQASRQAGVRTCIRTLHVAVPGEHRLLLSARPTQAPTQRVLTFREDHGAASSAQRHLLYDFPCAPLPPVWHVLLFIMHKFERAIFFKHAPSRVLLLPDVYRIMHNRCASVRVAGCGTCNI